MTHPHEANSPLLFKNAFQTAHRSMYMPVHVCRPEITIGCLAPLLYLSVCVCVYVGVDVLCAHIRVHVHICVHEG